MNEFPVLVIFLLGIVVGCIAAWVIMGPVFRDRIGVLERDLEIAEILSDSTSPSEAAWSLVPETPARPIPAVVSLWLARQPAQTGRFWPAVLRLPRRSGRSG